MPQKVTENRRYSKRKSAEDEGGEPARLPNHKDEYAPNVFGQFSSRPNARKESSIISDAYSLDAYEYSLDPVSVISNDESSDFIREMSLMEGGILKERSNKDLPNDLSTERKSQFRFEPSIVSEATAFAKKEQTHEQWTTNKTPPVTTEDQKKMAREERKPSANNKIYESYCDEIASAKKLQNYGQWKTNKTVPVTIEDEKKMAAEERKGAVNSKYETRSDDRSSPALSATPSSQRGVDESIGHRPPVPRSFVSDPPSSQSATETVESRPGAVAVPGPGGTLSQRNSGDDSLSPGGAVNDDSTNNSVLRHMQPIKPPGQGSERLITAFVVEDTQERGEVQPALTSLPLAVSTVVTDVKTRRRLMLLLVGCFFLIGTLGGALAAIMLTTGGDDKDQSQSTLLPTSPSTTKEPEPTPSTTVPNSVEPSTTDPPTTPTPTPPPTDPLTTPTPTPPPTDPPTTPTPTPPPTDPPTTPTPTPTPPPTTPPPFPSSYKWGSLGDPIMGSSGDEFGRAVSLSRDGKIIAIGARMGGDTGSLIDAGHVQVFELNGNDWNRLGYDIVGGNDKDNSGQTVSLSDDGKTVAIGAPERHKVRIYEYKGMNWHQLGSTIVGEQDDSADTFSTSYLSLSGNGRAVAIGAPWNDGKSGAKSGSVRVYIYSSSAKDWNQRGDDIDGDEAGDTLGFSTWLNYQGTIVAVGAFQHERDYPHAGYARVYKWEDNRWKAMGNRVKGEDSGDHFGVSVSMSNAANVLAVGGDLNGKGEKKSAGHVRVFQWNSYFEAWDQMGSDIDGIADGDLSGLASTLNGYGNVIAVGSQKNDDNGSDSGHVRVLQYIPSSNAWQQLGKTIVGLGSNDFLGISVALSEDGTIVAVGTEDGYAQVFELHN